MPDLTLDQLTLALAIVAGGALVGLITSVILAARLRRLHRAYALLRTEDDESDIISVVGRSLKRIDGVARRVDDLAAEQRSGAHLGRYALQKFHLVRYDAFDDMGGRLSFSAALLDDHGDGLVITSINGRSETRTYAKPVKNLTSEHNLSEEERAAIEGAMSGYARDKTPVRSH
ncbi:MAG: DUF4446 family protein [Actinomycetota bacterium]